MNAAQPLASTPVASPTPTDAVLRLLKQRVAERGSGGLVVGLLEPDGAKRVLAWGDPGRGQAPLAADSLFEIGSISKVFTAALLADMAQRGEVALDDPVQKYLPAGVTMPSRGGKTITLAMLSDQTSGLPRMPTNFEPADTSNPYADYDADKLYAFLSSYSLSRDPGAQYEYSNLGVGLLGHVLALRAGKTYEQLLRERIWKPLGMDHTSITPQPAQRQRLTQGHDTSGAVVPHWDFSVLAGGGAIRSTAGDMLKFLAAQLPPPRTPLARAMALTHQERAGTDSAEMGIGLGWHLRHSDGDEIVWHNGGTAGYRSFAGFRPAKGTAVVVLSNVGGEGDDDLGFHLLNPALPLAAAARRHTAMTLPPEVLDRYVGTYQLAPQVQMMVSREGDALFAQLTDQDRFRLWPSAETEFFVREADVKVLFQRDTAGKTTGLILQQGAQKIP